MKATPWIGGFTIGPIMPEWQLWLRASTSSTAATQHCGMTPTQVSSGLTPPMAITT